MNRIACLFLTLLGLSLGVSKTALAQSVKISPLSPSVTVKKTIQFTASVTGLTNTAVNWYAGQVLGGNTTAGTISAKGLYTAPAKLPAQNPVQIKAVCKANSTVSALTYVIILSAGPTITSVSPNPLSPGTINVTFGKEYAPPQGTSQTVHEGPHHGRCSGLTPRSARNGRWR